MNLGPHVCVYPQVWPSFSIERMPLTFGNPGIIQNQSWLGTLWDPARPWLCGVRELLASERPRKGRVGVSRDRCAGGLPGWFGFSFSGWEWGVDIPYVSYASVFWALMRFSPGF